MGCDIHLRVERRTKDGSWEVVRPGLHPNWFDEGDAAPIEEWPTPRNYYFFALCAGVRNYYQPRVEPIADPRGLPADMASRVDAAEQFGCFEEADAAGISDLGDHSFTWLLLSELQAGLDRLLTTGNEHPVFGRHLIASEYIQLIREEWPKLGDPDNVRIIMGFDS